MDQFCISLAFCKKKKKKQNKTKQKQKQNREELSSNTNKDVEIRSYNTIIIVFLTILTSFLYLCKRNQMDIKTSEIKSYKPINTIIVYGSTSGINAFV